MTTSATHAVLLDLPFELHCEIVRHLSLSASILYQTQICRSIRAKFDARWILTRPQSFQLVEWRSASIEVTRILRRKDDEEQQANATTTNPLTDGDRKSIWDTSPSSTPKPAPAQSVVAASRRVHIASAPFGSPSPSSAASTTLPSTEGYVLSGSGESLPMLALDFDVKLFVRCLRYLGKAPLSPSEADDHLLSMPRLRLSSDLRVLSLLSRTGFRVAALTQLLHALPALRSVETVLMTSAGYLEIVIWSVFIPSLTMKQPSGVRAMQTETLTTLASTYVETQAIVVPGPYAERGRGLQSGFRCFCFGSLAPTDPSAFHVIFHDWYDEQEAKGVQDMLECSVITCNSCKRTIFF